MGDSTHRVLITARSFGASSSEPEQLLRESGCSVVKRSGPFDQNELAELVRNVNPDAMIVGADEVAATVVESAGNLRVICQHGVGVDAIDLVAARNRNVVVANIPGANADAVADLTWALILCVARDVVSADRAVKEGRFPVFVGRGVSRKVLGILGLGMIGKAVARRAKGFDMRVVAYDSARDEQFAQRFGVEYAELDSVLVQSDYLTIHLPLTASTRGVISAEKLELMKPGSYLINMSRGGIVDEDALGRLVTERRLAGAATDVFAQEPPGKSNPLLSMPGIITTPHMGGRTVESLTEVSLRAAQAVVNILNGRMDGVHVVNM